MTLREKKDDHYAEGHYKQHKQPQYRWQHEKARRGNGFPYRRTRTVRPIVNFKNRDTRCAYCLLRSRFNFTPHARERFALFVGQRAVENRLVEDGRIVQAHNLRQRGIEQGNCLGV